MNTGVPTPADVLLAGHPHLRLDNSTLSAAEAARQVTAWMDQLPASSARDAR